MFHVAVIFSLRLNCDFCLVFVLVATFLKPQGKNCSELVTFVA